MKFYITNPHVEMGVYWEVEADGRIQAALVSPIATLGATVWTEQEWAELLKSNARWGWPVPRLKERAQ